MKDFQPGLWYLRDMAKIPAYYFLLIVGSVFLSSGIGLITNSTRSGSESVGFGFVSFGIITLVFLSIFQHKLLKDEWCNVTIKFRDKTISIKRALVDSLLFQYYFFSYSVLCGAYILWYYLQNDETVNINELTGLLLLTPIFFVIAHNNVGKFIRWVFALMPLVLILVFLCLIKFR
jgi:hypothetical protein